MDTEQIKQKGIEGSILHADLYKLFLLFSATKAEPFGKRLPRGLQITRNGWDNIHLLQQRVFDLEQTAFLDFAEYTNALQKEIYALLDSYDEFLQ